MKINSLYLIIAVVSLVLISSVIILLKYAKIYITLPFLESSQKQENLDYNYKKGDSWIEKVAGLKRDTSALPTNLMAIEIDERSLDPNQSGKHFELLVDKCDFYSMFCIDRVVRDFNVSFTVVKTENRATIYLNTDDKNIALNVAKSLKKYNIHTILKEI